MKRSHNVPTMILAALLLVLAGTSPAFGQNHLRELDTVRTSMTELGDKLPARIRTANIANLRTLERVFEINTYALTTIESYLKMIKIALSTKGTIDRETVSILNGWLDFIQRYCQKDLEYFQEALSETDDTGIAALIRDAQKNIQELMETAQRGIEENKRFLKR